MKNLIFVFAVMAFVGFSAASCNNEAPKSELEKKTEKMGEATKDLGNEVANSAVQAKDDVKDAAKGMKEDVTQARADLKKETQETIVKINDKIEMMDKKMQKATKEQKMAWEKDKKSLIQSRDHLNLRMKEFGQDMKESWKDFAADVKKTMQDVGDKINQ